MMEPKAKWERYGSGWSADVGLFTLEVLEVSGRCEIWNSKPSLLIWQHHAPTPCDTPDLMRITEAELARRLVKAAETMDGGGLVAEKPAQAAVGWAVAETEADCGSCHRDDCADCDGRVERAVAALTKTKPRFKVGDRVTFARSSDPLSGTVVDYSDYQGLFVVRFDDGSRLRCAEGLLEAETNTRLKVGDLVRSILLPGVVGVVTRQTAVPDALHIKWRQDEVCCSVFTLRQYALPPITSYADLADVLDELPDGTMVEVLADAGNVQVIYRIHAGHREVRFGDGTWERTLSLSGPFNGRRLCESSTVRIVPSSEVTI